MAASAAPPTSKTFLEFQNDEVFGAILEEFEAAAAAAAAKDAEAAAAGLLGKAKPNVIRDAEFKEIRRTDPNWMTYDYTIPLVTAEIINVCGAFGIERKLLLKEIALHAPNVEYDPKSFASCVMRIHREDCDPTATIFRTGKINITGAKSAAGCLAAANQIVQKIQQAGGIDGVKAGGASVKGTNFRVTNIQAKIQLPWNVDLEAFYKEVNAKIPKEYRCMEFEPEVRHRLSIDLPKPKCKICMFTTGAVIITGLTKEEDLEQVRKWVWVCGRKFSYSY